MVKSISIKELIISLQENYKTIGKTKLEYDKAIKNNHKGFIQSYQVHLKNLLKKRNSLLNLFSNKVQGKVIQIRYRYQSKYKGISKEDQALLVNLSQAEAKEILTLGFRMKGYTIEILEIIETQTFLSKGKL